MSKLKWQTWKRRADQPAKTHEQHVKDQWHWYKDASTPDEWAAEVKRNRLDLPHLKFKIK